MAMAPAVHNGINESFVGSSSSLTLNFYDENKDEIRIDRPTQPIEMWIERDKNSNYTFYQPVSATLIQIQPRIGLMPNGFYSKQANASLHIRIKPTDVNVGYLALLKLNDTPVVNATHKIYNKFKLLCPHSNDFIDDYYLFYVSQRELNNYVGNIGLGLRELTWNETQAYCSATLNEPPVVVGEPTNFTSNFSIGIFSAACFYVDKRQGKWSSFGVAVVNDTNYTYTHCMSSHLTEFAGGFVVLPSKINFEYVWANASFLNNPTIYITIIVVTCLYILFAIWSHYMDRADLKRVGVTPLADNKPGHNYYYEVIVFTGTRGESGTRSKVHMVLYGDRHETGVRILDDKNRTAFRRSGVDSFVMAVKKYYY